MKTIRLLLFMPVLISLISCKQYKTENKQVIEKYWETLDSSGFSVYLGSTIEKQRVFDIVITADLETDEVASQPGIDAADDPAIWVNLENPEKSLILGTNKKGGIHVFNLDGKELQYVQSGCMNNVDLRDDFHYNGKDVVLVAASNCANNTISLYYIDKTDLTLSDTIFNIKSSVDLVYGVCMYKSSITNKYYVFVNGEGADVEQWEVNFANGYFKSELVRTFKVSSRPEGMVADDRDGILYLGVEEEGILKINAEPEFEFKTVWVTGSNPSEKSLISSDIEGLALYKTDGKTYLIASSQGNFSFPVFEIGSPDRYLFSFVIDDGNFDGVIETDGLEITNILLNEKFPKGMIVLQDGYNFSGDTLKNQNFKYVSCEKLEDLIQNH